MYSIQYSIRRLQMSTAIYNNLTKAYFKESTVDEAIDNMVKEVNDIIAKQKK